MLPFLPALAPALSPLVPVLLGVGIGGTIVELFELGGKLLGYGSTDPAPGAPGAPELSAGTNTDGENERNRQNQQGGNRVGNGVDQGNSAQGSADEISAETRAKFDQIIEQLGRVAGRNTPDGGIDPETQSAKDQATRDSLRGLNDAIGGASSANQRLASALPNLMGGGMPGLGGGGMPGMGGGSNPFAALGGGPNGPAPVNPLAADTGPDGPTPETVNPLAPPAADQPGTSPAPVSSPEVQPAGHSTPSDDGNTNSPLTLPTPNDPAIKDVTGPDGEKTTAPDETAATALRHALDHPGEANQAASAYLAAGINLPADGADPGQLVSSTDIQPGDIARWDEPPRDLMVFGNGKVIDSSGKLADLSTLLTSGVFNGFFRPSRTSAPSSSTPQPAAAPEPEPDTLTAQIP